MFEFIAIVGSILSFVGGMQQASQQKKAAAQQAAAAEESRRIGDRNAARIEAETKEKARRESLAAKERQGLTRARQAASGGAASGSNVVYLDEMIETDEKNIDWLRKSGASQADIARREGNYNYLSGMASSTSTRAAATGSKFGAFGSLLGGAQSGYELYQKQ